MSTYVAHLCPQVRSGTGGSRRLAGNYKLWNIILLWHKWSISLGDGVLNSYVFKGDLRSAIELYSVLFLGHSGLCQVPWA